MNWKHLRNALSPLSLLSPSPLGLQKEANQGKVEFELLNKIRVVSGQHFSFPIWIGNTVIPVRVGKTAVKYQFSITSLTHKTGYSN